MLALLKKKFPQWFPIALWGLIGCGLVAVIVVAFVLLTRIPRPAPEITATNVETNIRTWLDSFHLSSKKMDDPQSLFALVVTLDNGTRMVIARPKLLDRYIVLQSSITISQEDKAIFDGLPLEERAIFAARLSAELSRTGMGFTMDLAQNNITLTRRVPITSNLTEGTFMENFDEMDSAKILVLRTVVLMLLDAKRKINSTKSS